MGVLYTRGRSGNFTRAKEVRVVTESGNWGGSYTPEECMDAFFAYSAKKRKNYDILNTNYADPSGYAEGSYTTPADLFRIGLIVASNSKSVKWWGGREKYATVNFMGEHEREVTFPDLWNGVGGTRYCNKSGGVSHSDGKHRAGFQMTTINNKHAAISIMINGADHYDYITTYISNIKQMLRDLDAGNTVTEPEGLAAMVAAGGGYVASFLPGDIAMYQQVTYDQMISSDGTSGVLKDFMIRNNPNAKNVPASTTKIMTMMCVLDTMPSELEIVEVIDDDITGGSGLEVFPGDRLTVGDALFLMMRNSNNTISATLARNVGKWILENRTPMAQEDGTTPYVESTTYPGCYYRMVDGEQEWDNPPMAVGVEYRTTERCEGKAVYVKRVSYTFTENIGNEASNTDYSIPHGISGLKRIVRCFVTDGEAYQLPYYSSGGGYIVLKSVVVDNINLRAYKATMLARTLYFDVYYTKA